MKWLSLQRIAVVMLMLYAAPALAWPKSLPYWMGDHYRENELPPENHDLARYRATGFCSGFALMIGMGVPAAVVYLWALSPSRQQTEVPVPQSSAPVVFLPPANGNPAPPRFISAWSQPRVGRDGITRAFHYPTGRYYYLGIDFMWYPCRD